MIQRWPAELRAEWRRNLDAGLLSDAQLVVSAALERAEAYAANLAFDALAMAATSKQSPPQSSSDPSVAKDLSTLLLKPVGDKCNLGCPYCYEVDRRNNSSPTRMESQALAQLLDNLLPFVRKPFHIFLHGGEPLLAGKAFFRDLIEQVANHPHGSQVRFGVQTNAVLIDKEWAELFRERAISVGVSLDGPPEVHDAQRTGKHGEATHSAVLMGIRCLQEADVPFGVTSVITAPHAQRDNAAAELLQYLVSLGITQFDAHPAYAPIGPSQDWNLTPALYASFMQDLFDSWIAHGDPNLQVRSIEEFFRGMTGFEGQTCFRSQSCTSIIGAEPDGSTNPCTRPFVEGYAFGNLVELPLPEIQSNSSFTNFVAHEAQGRFTASPCEWAHLCGHGGCPHERLENGRQSVKGRHVYCTCSEHGEPTGYPAIYRYFQQQVERRFRTPRLEVGNG